MGYQCSTCSWFDLARLRRRGQVPAGGVVVTDHHIQRRNLEASGAYALPLPQASDAYLVAGLPVTLFADPTEQAIEAAQVIAGSNPRRFVTLWRGRDPEVVIA